MCTIGLLKDHGNSIALKSHVIRKPVVYRLNLFCGLHEADSYLLY